jgi:hypothetical protein
MWQPEPQLEIPQQLPHIPDGTPEMTRVPGIIERRERIAGEVKSNEWMHDELTGLRRWQGRSKSAPPDSAARLCNNGDMRHSGWGFGEFQCDSARPGRLFSEPPRWATRRVPVSRAAAQVWEDARRAA